MLSLSSSSISRWKSLEPHLLILSNLLPSESSPSNFICLLFRLILLMKFSIILLKPFLEGLLSDHFYWIKWSKYKNEYLDGVYFYKDPFSYHNYIFMERGRDVECRMRHPRNTSGLFGLAVKTN